MVKGSKRSSYSHLRKVLRERVRVVLFLPHYVLKVYTMPDMRYSYQVFQKVKYQFLIL